METRKPKYNSLAEWKKSEPNAYQWAYRHGILYKICDLFGWKNYAIKKGINLTLNDCKVEALKYKTRNEWSCGHNSSYGKANRNGWLEECCKHMMVMRIPLTFNSIEQCQKDALKYKSRSEWARTKGSSYQFSRKQGWLEECCIYIPSRYKPKGYWTLEKCIKESFKYKTRSEWINKGLSSYREASKNKWIEECCSHMKQSSKPKEYWTLEKCKEEALKYKKRTEWATLSGSSYKTAHKNKWINECCLHMVKNKKNYEKTEI